MNYRIIVSIAVSLLSSSALLFGGTNQSAAVAGIMRDVTELGDVLQKNHAVFEPAAATNVVEAIIKAIDRHAEVLTPEQAKLRAEELRGVFYGVGLSVTFKNKLPTVTDVIKDSPAASAGLKPGNIIEKIGDRKTEGLPLEELVSKLRGAKDEAVRLAVRADEKSAETKEYTLKRSLVQMPVTGLTEQWSYQICFLKINGLYENSGAQIATQLVAWSETKCSGIILDLRNADGGDLAAAADVAGLLLPAGAPIMNVRDGNDAVVTAYKNKAEKTISAPVMVLINRDTSGAAETLAAILGKSKGVLIIGEATRGDDCIREFLPLADGRIVYLATRKVEILSGLPYNGVGVQPHVAVAPAKTEEPAGEIDNGPLINLSEEERNHRALLRRTRGDPVLQRATDILLGLKALDIKGR